MLFTICILGFGEMANAKNWVSFLGGGETHLVGSGWEFWMHSKGITYENPLDKKKANKFNKILGICF